MKGIAVLSLGLFGLGGCLHKAVPLDRPVPLDLFTWGGTLSQNEGRLHREGWRKSEAEDETVHFVIRLTQDASAPGEKEPEVPYRLTLYLHKNRLVAVRILRRDTASNLDVFDKNVIQGYALGKPVSEGKRPTLVTPTGNRITREVSVFEHPGYFVRIIRERIQASEPEIARGISEETECMVFSRAENEGLSVDALAKP